MAVFAIVSLRNDLQLDEIIARVYWKESLRVSPSHWLVIDKGTPREVAERLGINAGHGEAIIYNVSSCSGRAPNSVWEWLQSRWNS
jgi:hypothetical protein